MTNSTKRRQYWAGWAVIGGLMLLSTTAMAQGNDFTVIDGDFAQVNGQEQSANLDLFGNLVVTGLYAIENWAAPLLSMFLAATGGFNGFYKGDWGRAGMMLVGAIFFGVFPLVMTTLMSFT